MAPDLRLTEGDAFTGDMSTRHLVALIALGIHMVQSWHHLSAGDVLRQLAVWVDQQELFCAQDGEDLQPVREEGDGDSDKPPGGPTTDGKPPALG